MKLHVLLDHGGYLPVFAHLTEGKSHELLMAHKLRLPKGSNVAMRYVTCPLIPVPNLSLNEAQHVEHQADNIGASVNWDRQGNDRVRR